MVGAGAILAACSSANHPSASGTTSTTSHTKNTTTTQATPTTLPVPPTSGPLSISATVAVPIPANVQITATEAPNGAVFVSQESQDSSVTTVVWVLDPSGPAEVAEHVSGGVSALAADPTNLYVVADDSVIGYTRSTGNQMGQWKLPPIDTANTSDADLVSMVAANGQVLVMIAQGNLQDVYRINPNSTAAPKMIAQGTERGDRARRLRVLRAIRRSSGQDHRDGRDDHRSDVGRFAQWRGGRYRRGRPRWPVGWSGSANRRGRASTPS